jgi:hypothetical protein
LPGRAGIAWIDLGIEDFRGFKAQLENCFHRRDAESAEKFIFLFAAERAANKKHQPLLGVINILYLKHKKIHSTLS